MPIPALVRDSNLAPYQDLCYFVRPAEHELEYIAKVDDEFDEILAELEQPPAYENGVPRLQDWVYQQLNDKILPGGKSVTWTTYAKRTGNFSDAARMYLKNCKINLPHDVPQFRGSEWGRMSYLRPVLDRYVRHGLRRSELKEDHKKGEILTSRLRLLGMQITETGIRPCASPVGRLWFAATKIEALSEIISTEMQSLGQDIRAVIVTDFEKTSATALVEGVMDDEAGGAIAAFRSLVKCDSGDMLDPILMTGSTVLVDDDLSERFLEAARAWITERNLDIELKARHEETYHVIVGRGKDWIPRYYSLMITEFFQQGLTKCLIGTRDFSVKAGMHRKSTFWLI